MKFSTEAIVAVSVAIVFALMSVGAIAREQGEPARGGHHSVIAVSNVHLSRVGANKKDVLGLY
jgi:hypothetical protein